MIILYSNTRFSVFIIIYKNFPQVKTKAVTAKIVTIVMVLTGSAVWVSGYQL